MAEWYTLNTDIERGVDGLRPPQSGIVSFYGAHVSYEFNVDTHALTTINRDGAGYAHSGTTIMPDMDTGNGDGTIYAYPTGETVMAWHV